MFGKDLMAKLQQMQTQAAETKEKLEKITVQGEAGGNLILVDMNGNRRLKKLTINCDLGNMEKEDLEDLLTVALNRAIEAADKVNESEMAKAAQGFLPGM
ncbi:MAG: YbaB/EbfC family nucleoid-associated protein [Brumimicrobium sp.]|nr:YbaB/EbfC family nucleoid-associated protein [Brumimicrobium sp.]